MRLKKEIKTFIKEAADKQFPGSKIYLFGSRLNDEALGGDIDILILSKEKIDNKKLRAFRLDFYKECGWQKIDLVNFTTNDDTTFKRLILTEAQAI